MLVSALLALLTVVALPKLHISNSSGTRLSSIVLFCTSFIACHICTSIGLEAGVELFGGILHASPTSFTVDAILGLFGFLAIVPWASFDLVKRYTIQNNTVFSLIPTNIYWALLILFSVSGSSLLVSSSSLLSLYLSLELQSFGVYVLAALYRESETATDAGLTYFLLGGLSSCFILLGTGQLYASLGVADLNLVYDLLTPGTSDLTDTVGFSFSVLACGLSFKVAGAPFHQWAPDVYDRVPTIVTSWLQTIPKLAVFGLFLEITAGLNISRTYISETSSWTNTLIIVAVLSLVIGSIIGLAQTRVKRLLTYSTISHVGFILLALTAFSVDAVSAFFFYLIQYSFTSLASLSVLLGFGYILRGKINENIPSRAHATDIELLSELTGQVRSEPILCLGFSILLFSIAGVPPFVGFFAKQGVLETSLQAHFGGLAVLAIIVSVVSASYYLKVVHLINFTNKNSNINNITSTLSSSHSFTMSVIIFLISSYMLLPSNFLDSTRSLAITIILG